VLEEVVEVEVVEVGCGAVMLFWDSKALREIGSANGYLSISPDWLTA